MTTQQEPMPREFYENDPVFQRLQWEVRTAFELGFMASGKDRGKSNVNPEKGEWFDHWMASTSRQFLIDNGIISGKDTYR